MKKLNSFAFLSLFAMAAFLVFSGDSIRVELFFSDGRKSEILEQHESTNPNPQSRCELLSKVDIFDIRNNCKDKSIYRETVVNCSQKLISLIFGTTNIYIQYRYYGCELLSKVDIFDIRNNEQTRIVDKIML